MPLVFVHGVATRRSEEYRARVHQRDTLFKRLVLPKRAEIFDPDWGSNAVKFTASMPWLPQPRASQAWTLGAGIPAGETRIAEIAKKKPEIAIDLAFEAGLAARVQASVKTRNPGDALTDDELAPFEAAVRYLEQGADRDAFDPEAPDSTFLSVLARELEPHMPATAVSAQAMGWGGPALKWIGDGLKSLVAPVANIGSDAVLRVVRRPLSESLALFLGDIFVYLRWRDTVGAGGTEERIFGPIAADLTMANKLRKETDPLIVVGHSLGGVILYDLFCDPGVVAKIGADSGAPLRVDAWITVGAQPGLFADMGLYAPAPSGETPLPRPDPVRNWLNVYDWTDVLSFRCEKIFSDVRDYEFDNVSGLFASHSAYFQRPSFYQRLQAHLKELALTA